MDEGQQINKQGRLPNSQQKPTHTRRFSIASGSLATSTSQYPLPNPLSSSNLLSRQRSAQKPDTNLPNKRHTRHLSLGNHGISRHGTLLTPNATPTRTTAELGSILGDRHARLKSKAALVRLDSGSAMFNRHVTLEQAKPRARVEVDILPQTNICVQGGYLRGHFKIHVREKTSGEGPIDIGEGKIRIIGFEGQGDKTKAIFYDCSAILSSITQTSLAGLWETELDPEGFAPAIEGEHTFPFSLYLPLSAEKGRAKGIHRGQSSTYLNYIAMISLKVKDESGRRSIAHFYRICEVWPRLDPSSVLSPGLRPLQATVSATSSNDPDAGRVKLTATLHRLHWIAGQRCYIKIIANNKTKKTLKELTLILCRSTTIFPSGIGTNQSSPRRPSTNVKHVSESTLKMGHMGTKGHASAKGWWSGVRPGQVLEFEQHIMIPSDALTVSRGQIFGVEYSLRITVESGFRLTSGLELEIPIRVINFISIDPPCSLPVASISNHSGKAAETTNQNSEAKTTPFNHNEVQGPDQNNNIQEAGVGNLSLSKDPQGVVQRAIVGAHPLTEIGMMGFASFSGLYYASTGNGGESTLGDENYSTEFPRQSTDNDDDESIAWALNNFVDETSMSKDLVADIHSKETGPSHVPRKSSFAARVEEKISNATAAYLNDVILEDSFQEEARLDASFKPNPWDGTGRSHLESQVPHVLAHEQEVYPQSTQTSDSQKHVNCNHGLDPSLQPLHEIQSALAHIYDVECTDWSDTSSWLEPTTSSTSSKSAAHTPVQALASRLVSLPGQNETLRQIQVSLDSMCTSVCTPVAMLNDNEIRRDNWEDSRKLNTGFLNTCHYPCDDSDQRQQVDSGGLKPTLVVPASATSTTSTVASIGNTSVRDKIRELEERVKAATLV